MRARSVPIHSLIADFLRRIIYLIKHSYRNLRRYWSYSLINILGLSMGMISLVIISLWVKKDFTFMIKTDSAHTTESIRSIKAAWDQVYPEYAFDYSFLDEFYQHAYNGEISQARLSGYFMIIAIIIACMCLFGLASISIEQRTREIGIRKVIGATSFDIVLMLNREFTSWVILGVIIALPVSWYLVNLWSENFEYKAGFAWWNFVLPGISVLLIAWLTVGYRTIKASCKNPVDVIGHE